MGELRREHAGGAVTSSAEPTLTMAATQATRDSQAFAGSTTGARTENFAADALLLDQMGRVSSFARLMMALCAIGATSLPFLGGDPVAKKVLWVSLAVATAAAGAMEWLTRDPARYSDGRIALAVQVQCAGGVGALYYYGAFSSLACIISLAIYVYGLGARTLHAGLVYAHLAIGHATIALLVISGTIQDRGLINADYLPVGDAVIMHAGVQTVYGLALLLGRLSRRKTREAVEQMERATRNVAQREALLDEARQEIERAAQLGGAGRFTGQTVGSFELGVVLGRGAMGEVYEATHATSGELAAVKLLHRTELIKPASVARFAREAKIAASIDSPYVVQIKEVGELHSVLPYLAMERLEGHDLAHYLREHPRTDLSFAVELVDQVARGLEAAHAVGIVHRDLKPHNVFQHRPPGARPIWKILDFGVSKLVDDGATLTGGGLIGTPAYMAPEQARGGVIDARADVCALAIIAYRCITGHPAFPGNDVAVVLHRITSSMPAQPSSLGDVGRDVEAVLAVGLARTPKDRFATATEFATCLAAASARRLDPDVHARARRILSQTPWGAPARTRGRPTQRFSLER